MRRPRRALILTFAFAFLALAPKARAKTQIQLKVQPGPAVISPEEQAIEPDAARGTEHAVILLEETDRQESAIHGHKTSYHLRAKILSNEGRELANVTIPVYTSDGKVTQWWGRTILPDGTVQELKQSQLDQQSVAKSDRLEAREIKAALPGVVPGAVIDYGYVLEEGWGVLGVNPVQLQRRWAVRELKYRWHPAEGLSSAFRVRQGDDKDVKVTRGPGEILIEARNLLPVVEEPYMPPDQEVRASVVFYYLSLDADKDFWNTEAKRIERSVKAHLGNLDRLREALAVMQLPADGGVSAQLRAAYQWIAANVQNAWLRSVDELESLAEDWQEGKVTWSARSVLDARKGDGRQLDVLFIGVARALGADANLVLAADRTQGLWDQGFFSTSQFDSTVVAVQVPGAPEGRPDVVDPGSGLPYGELPWWLTGTRGFLTTKDGARSVMLSATDPARNTEDTDVSVSFSDDNQAMLARWTTVKSGQPGLGDRRELRALAPSERTKRLDSLCGANSLSEVSRAEAPGLDDLTAPFRLECECEISGTNLDDEIGLYSVYVGGPWLVEHAEFSSPRRVHPMIFDFLRTDMLRGRLKAPNGFQAMEAPAPVELSLPGASYSLSFERTDDGYRWTRQLNWKALMILPGAYDNVRKFLADVRAADRTQLKFQRVGAGR